MSKNPTPDDELVMYRVVDMPKVTNGMITERQARRYISERRLAVFKPAGASGPAYIRRVDLLQFIRDNTIPAIR